MTVAPCAGEEEGERVEWGASTHTPGRSLGSTGRDLSKFMTVSYRVVICVPIRSPNPKPTEKNPHVNLENSQKLWQNGSRVELGTP